MGSSPFELGRSFSSHIAFPGPRSHTHRQVHVVLCRLVSIIHVILSLELTLRVPPSSSFLSRDTQTPKLRRRDDSIPIMGKRLFVLSHRPLPSFLERTNDPPAHIPCCAGHVEEGSRMRL